MKQFKNIYLQLQIILFRTALG